MLSLRTNVVDDLAKKEYEDANCERLKRQAEALRDRAKSMMRSGRLLPLTNVYWLEWLETNQKYLDKLLKKGSSK